MINARVYRLTSDVNHGSTPLGEPHCMRHLVALGSSSENDNSGLSIEHADDYDKGHPTHYHKNPDIRMKTRTLKKFSVQK